MKAIFIIIGFIALGLGLSSFNGDNDSEFERNLFNIGRTKDSNIICYDVKLDAKGDLMSENPIEVFWIRHTENDELRPLTLIQKRYAYGLKYITKSKENAVFQFVSYSKRSFYLKKNLNGVYKVYSLFDGELIELHRIYIHLEGGSFWFPKITEVEFSGVDAINGKEFDESIFF